MSPEGHRLDRPILMGFGKSPASINEYTEDFLNPVSCSTSLIVNNLSILLLLARLDDRTFRNGTLERLTHKNPGGIPGDPAREPFSLL